jgi:hypothetical protein
MKFPSGNFWLGKNGLDISSTWVTVDAPATPAGGGSTFAVAISSGGWISV